MIKWTPIHDIAIQMLWRNGFLTITGQPGDGKSSMAEWLIKKLIMSPKTMPDKGDARSKERFVSYSLAGRGERIYEYVKVNSPADWENKVDTSKYQVVLIDDIFGTSMVNMHTVRGWKKTLLQISKQIMANMQKLVVIICLHKSHHEALTGELAYLDLFRKDMVFDMTESKFQPEQAWREKIMSANGGYRGLDYREKLNLDYKNISQSYPYVARMFGSVKSFTMEGPKFFSNPFQSFKNAIQKVLGFNKTIYLTLAIGILFDGELELDKHSFEEFTDKEQHIIRRLSEALGVEDLNLSKMRYSATLLYGLFLLPTKRHGWKFMHERSYHTMAEAVTNKFPALVIELCSSDFLINRIRTTSSYSSNVVTSVTVWHKEHAPLCQRFTFEILAGNLPQIAGHPTFDDEKFVKMWFEFMTEMGSLLPVVQQRGEYNRSLFFWCCYYGQRSTVEEYLKHEDLEDMRQEEWFKEEMRAGVLATCSGQYGIRLGHAKVLEALHKAGMALSVDDPLPEDDLEDLYGSDVAFLLKMKAPLLHIAALRCEDSVVDYLLDMGKLDVNEKSAEGYTACHRAVCNKKEGALKALLRHKADANEVAPNGRRPIHLALMSGNGNVIQTLRMNNEKVKDGKMPDGSSMLTSAIFAQDDYLIRSIADTYTKENPYKAYGDLIAPLQAAASLGDENNVQRLLDKNFDINSRDDMGWTALHYAVYFHNEKMISFLLDKKADIDCQNRDNKTPLHIAAEQGYYIICELLLENGANTDKHTMKNEFSFSSAAKYGHVALARYMVRQGLILSTPNGGKAGDIEDPPSFRDRDSWDSRDGRF
ncbi:Ankyrin-1 [Mizuhopecten yessoensis]|uniref:Ankyrin-1 n=2 Tax=Mizuhopecten yessoensis TaxID=6573 RepID=A0A210QX55_MIZYE|nr:Ankyrin-1 [Mizuhopecten yessoensis]